MNTLAPKKLSRQEITKAVRKALKDAGYSNRKVSVKFFDMSTDSSTEVTIKCDSVDVNEVKNILRPFDTGVNWSEEDYGRTIMGGGNHYIELTSKSGRAISLER